MQHRKWIAIPENIKYARAIITVERHWKLPPMAMPVLIFDP